MSWFDQFRDHISIDKDAYRAVLRESEDLRSDKKRLTDEVDGIKVELKTLREENMKLLAAARVAPPPITKEVIAKKLGIPLGLVDQIDFERIGFQLPDEQGRKH